MQALTGLRQFFGYDAVPADYDVIGDLAYQPIQAKVEDLQAQALRERPDYPRCGTGNHGGPEPDRAGQSELQGRRERYL